MPGPAIGQPGTSRIVIADMIPDGTYRGTWSGYRARFTNHESPCTYEVTTDKGVRGMNIPCTVTVKDGQITVEAD